MSKIIPNKPITKQIGMAIGSTYPNQSLTTTRISNPGFSERTVIQSPKQVASYNNKPPDRRDVIILGSLSGKLPNVPIPSGYAWMNIGSKSKPQWSLQRSSI